MRKLAGALRDRLLPAALTAAGVTLIAAGLLSYTGNVSAADPSASVEPTIVAAEPGASISDGDEIAFVEAMKMEIPVTSTTAGKIKAFLVKLDEMIAEGQVVAIVEA